MLSLGFLEISVLKNVEGLKINVLDFLAMQSFQLLQSIQVMHLMQLVAGMCMLLLVVCKHR